MSLIKEFFGKKNRSFANSLLALQQLTDSYLKEEGFNARQLSSLQELKKQATGNLAQSVETKITNLEQEQEKRRANFDTLFSTTEAAYQKSAESLVASTKNGLKAAFILETKVAHTPADQSKFEIKNIEEDLSNLCQEHNLTIIPPDYAIVKDLKPTLRINTEQVVQFIEEDLGNTNFAIITSDNFLINEASNTCWAALYQEDSSNTIAVRRLNKSYKELFETPQVTQDPESVEALAFKWLNSKSPTEKEEAKYLLSAKLKELNTLMAIVQ